MSQKNKYSILLKNSAIAHNEFHKWKRQCTTVILNGEVRDYELTILHQHLTSHFSELIAEHIVDDAGVNGIVLIAPIEDVKAALELVLELINEKVRTKYGDRIQCIIDNCKTGESLRLSPNIYYY